MANQHGTAGAGPNAGKKPNPGNDDIERGNVGTADQNPSDIYPDRKVDEHSGEVPRGDNAPPVHPPHRREEIQQESTKRS